MRVEVGAHLLTGSNLLEVSQKYIITIEIWVSDAVGYSGVGLETFHTF